MQTGVSSARRRANKRDGSSTPDASARASRRTSGTSSVDSKGEKAVKEKKSKDKSTMFGELTRGVIHVVFVVAAMLGVIVLFEYSMLHHIEWEWPKVQQPKLMSYYGASIITKDVDCSILARRCYMSKERLRACFVQAFICISMLRPDMFPTKKNDQTYYLNVRHVTSMIDLKDGIKKESFKIFHQPVKRTRLISSLYRWDKSFYIPLTNTKGMPRDNQLFFIPWEIRDQEEKYKDDFTYVDMNMDDINDCIQPKVNTDVGRRDWIADMNWPASALNAYSNDWTRETTQNTDRFRVITVPGFTGQLVKKILDVSMGMIDQELAHSARGEHSFTDDMVLMIYRHVLLHAIRNPFQLIFREKEWKKNMADFLPETPLTYSDWDKMPILKDAGSSISFLFGAKSTSEKTTKIPDTLAVTISEYKTRFGHMPKMKAFDLNVPIRITSGLTTTEIVTSAQGERAFHANIITALRIMLRLRMYKGASNPDFNDVLHIPMAFYSLEEKKMIFDRYSIQTALRDALCKKIEHCATPYDQHSIDWQTRFNGTTAIQFHGTKRVINSRVETSQDKNNYAVGF